MANGTSLLRNAIVFPIRPTATVRTLRAEGGILRFALSLFVLVSLWAGLRAALQFDGGSTGLFRFGTSLLGFVVLPALVLLVGRLLGGKGSWALLAAVFAGCAVPFLLIDSLWIAALLVARDAWMAGEAGALVGFGILVHAERLIQGWAAVVLLFGLAEVQAFSRWRAVVNVGAIVLVAAGAVFAVRAAIG